MRLWIALTFMAVLLTMLYFVVGCQEYAAGVATGVTAMKELAEDSQEKFIVAMSELNAETDELNTKIDAVKSINLNELVKPETVEAVKSLKEQADDPALWIALLSMFAGGTGVNL